MGQTHCPSRFYKLHWCNYFFFGFYATFYISQNNQLCSNAVLFFAFSALAKLEWHATCRSICSSPKEFPRKVVEDDDECGNEAVYI